MLEEERGKEGKGEEKKKQLNKVCNKFVAGEKRSEKERERGSWFFDTNIIKNHTKFCLGGKERREERTRNFTWRENERKEKRFKMAKSFFVAVHHLEETFFYNFFVVVSLTSGQDTLMREEKEKRERERKIC